VAEQFRRAGLQVAEESFPFQTFELRTATIEIDQRKVPVLRLGFDPYKDTKQLDGQALVIEPASNDSSGAYAGLGIEDKIVVTLSNARFYPLLSQRPRAIAFVAPGDFEVMRLLTGKQARIVIDGAVQRRTSVNIVGRQKGAQGGEEILITAHLDSVATPGANDNASGVAVLIELVRPLLALNLPVPLQFVSFGAEEPGFIGSRTFLQRHLEDLRHCRLVFNFDSVAGPGPMRAETADGVRGVPPELGTQLPGDMVGEALDDINERWSLLRQERTRLFTSNVPPWLQETIRVAAEASGRPYLPGRQMGSDHLTFAQAGIVSTNVAVVGGHVHTAEDTVSNVNVNSLELAGRFALSVIQATALRTG
jgi:hypothetical protein